MEATYDVNIIGMGGPGMEPEQQRTLIFQINSRQLSARIQASDKHAEKLMEWAAEMEHATRPMSAEEFIQKSKEPENCGNCGTPERQCPKTRMPQELAECFHVCGKHGGPIQKAIDPETAENDG
jgi:hypothetical protein